MPVACAECSWKVHTPAHLIIQQVSLAAGSDTWSLLCLYMIAWSSPPPSSAFPLCLHSRIGFLMPESVARKTSAFAWTKGCCRLLHGPLRSSHWYGNNGPTVKSATKQPIPFCFVPIEYSRNLSDLSPVHVSRCRLHAALLTHPPTCLGMPLLQAV